MMEESGVFRKEQEILAGPERIIRQKKAINNKK